MESTQPIKHRPKIAASHAVMRMCLPVFPRGPTPHQSTMEAKAQLREALAAEQATAAVRTSELARLSEREVRLSLQVEALSAELAKLKAESSRALKVGGRRAGRARIFRRGRP